LNKQSFDTIKASADNLTVVNKSKFYGYAVHVESPEEAMEAYARQKKQFPDASHHCYAYIIGKQKEQVKFSDDGEPGGTAGLPMAEALKQSDLTDILVVVTRYFGGIKLGAGGLVRAYSGAVVETLKAANIVRYVPCGIYRQMIDYDLWAKIAPKVEAMGAQIIESEYLEKIYLTVGIKEKQLDAIKKVFQEALRSDDILEYMATEYVEETRLSV